MFTLPDLPYDYSALGNYISKDIMTLHHDKHHQAYVDNLNKIVDATSELKNKSLIELLVSVDNLPESARTAVRNHGGGHYNHSLFWEIMSPQFDSQPSGQLGDAINAKYSSFQAFVDEFSAQALAVFGSGWAWLMPDMSIVTTPNQDNPLMNGGVEPLLGLDIWEHAYYLDYQNRRADYIAAWWHVVNWPVVAARLQ